MIQYTARIVCETEIGDEKGFHYHREVQEVIDDTIKCPTHPEATVRDFVIETTDEVV